MEKDLELLGAVINGTEDLLDNLEARLLPYLAGKPSKNKPNTIATEGSSSLLASFRVRIEAINGRLLDYLERLGI